MRAAFLLLLWIPFIAFGTEERSLGKSPDGEFELVLKAEHADDCGWVVVRNVSSGRVSMTETGQGFGCFRTDDVKAMWKADCTAFAVSVRGTKTSTDTDVYIRDGEVWERIEFPPFVANILGRQGVFLTGRNQNVDFAGFEGASRFSLVCHVEPDFQQKEESEKIVGWRPSHETDWKVVLEYRRRTRPNCVIVRIEPFKEPISGDARGGEGG